jgi:hypothetical protein
MISVRWKRVIVVRVLFIVILICLVFELIKTWKLLNLYLFIKSKKKNIRFRRLMCCWAEELLKWCSVFIRFERWSSRFWTRSERLSIGTMTTASTDTTIDTRSSAWPYLLCWSHPSSTMDLRLWVFLFVFFSNFFQTLIAFFSYNSGLLDTR